MNPNNFKMYLNLIKWDILYTETIFISFNDKPLLLEYKLLAFAHVCTHTHACIQNKLINKLKIEIEIYYLTLNILLIPMAYQI